MLLLRTCAELLRWCASLRWQQRPLHFVPTMGALHEGHLSLIRRAALAQPVAGAEPVQPGVLVSVFVNPLQFGPGEDFQRYPRDLETDAATAAVAGAHALFAPSVEDLFPGGEAEVTRVIPPASLLETLCARSRPGHFDGVATVIARLLALIRPDRLLLGEKDWQQLVVLRRVVAALGLPVRLQGCPTWREADGLAGSSRNRYLSPAERQRASAIPVALLEAAEAWRCGGLSEERLLAELRDGLEASGLQVDYAELVGAQTLQPPPSGHRGLALLAVAVNCGSSRLIDHHFLMSRAPIVAIDGPAGAGKSTVTRAFARRLGLLYLDTGAMYRAVTWWVQRHGVDPADPEAVALLLGDLDLRLEGGLGAEQRVWIKGHEVTAAIRHPDLTAAVSAVAAHAAVREALTGQQQAMGERGGLVAEGRDIGTAVFPDADLKVFLTASVQERARRRALDLEQRGFPPVSLLELEGQIAERDRLDSCRAVAPLAQADDAIELISDGLEIEAVIQALVDLFRERVPEEAWPGT